MQRLPQTTFILADERDRDYGMPLIKGEPVSNWLYERAKVNEEFLGELIRLILIGQTIRIERIRD